MQKKKLIAIRGHTIVSVTRRLQTFWRPIRRSMEVKNKTKSHLTYYNSILVIDDCDYMHVEGVWFRSQSAAKYWNIQFNYLQFSLNIQPIFT